MNRMSKTASIVNTILGERRFIQTSNDCTRFLKKRSAKAERQTAKQVIARSTNEQVMGFDLPWPAVEKPPVTERTVFVAIDRDTTRPLHSLMVDEIVAIEQTFYVSH
jgi:hypothetical protein